MARQSAAPPHQSAPLIVQPSFKIFTADDVRLLFWVGAQPLQPDHRYLDADVALYPASARTLAPI